MCIEDISEYQKTNSVHRVSDWISAFAAYQRSGTQKRAKTNKCTHDSATHTRTHWALGSDERRSQFNTILLSCPQARLQSEPASDKLAVISAPRYRTNAHILSPCNAAEALLGACKHMHRHTHTSTHRPAFYLQNTRWNDSSNPTGGFTDHRDRVTEMAAVAPPPLPPPLPVKAAVMEG